MKPDTWIADGCAAARRAMDEGDTGHAANILAYVEARALGTMQRSEKAIRDQQRRVFRLCSVRDCETPRERSWRPWCCKHRPRFDRRVA